MPSVALVTRTRPGISGQNIYEVALASALRARGVDAVVLRVGGVRDRSADVRLPLGLQRSMPAALRELEGIVTYPAGLVHRLDLAAPPARGEVLTVHDLAPLRYDDEGELPRDALRSIRRARIVITVSEYSAAEIEQASGRSDTVVIPNGVSSDVAAAVPLSEADLARLSIHRPFVLHVGGASRRKNLAALAAAWQLATPALPEMELLLCGPEDARRTNAFSGVAAARYLGPIERGLLLRLMKRAQAVVIPSTYEGFGLPALEAMAARVPVIAARRAALPEVCGAAATLVEPTPEGIAAGIVAAVRDGSTNLDAGAARAASFSWDAAAAAHERIYAATA